jgi:hypothetical protein
LALVIMPVILSNECRALCVDDMSPRCTPSSECDARATHMTGPMKLPNSRGEPTRIFLTSSTSWRLNSGQIDSAT